MERQPDAGQSPRGLKALLEYLPMLRGQSLELAGVIVLMLISTAVSLAIPMEAGRFVDRLGEGLDSIDLSAALTVLVVLLLVQLGGSFLYQYLSRRLGLRTVTKLRARLFAHLLSLPSLYFTHQKAGDLSSRMTSDVGSIQYLLTTGLVSFVRAVITLVGAVILMIQLNGRLTVVVLLLVPTTILLVSLFGRRLQRLSRRMFDELGEISNHVQEVAGAIRVVKVFGSEQHEQQRFQDRIDGFLNAGERRAWLSAAMESSSQILLWITLISVVVYGFYLSSRGQCSYGELVSFMLLAFRVAMPMGSLTSLYASAQGAAAAAERLDAVFGVSPENVSTEPVARRLRAVPDSGRVELRDVWFSYSDDRDRWTLAEISVDIAPGERVALVGPSGAGKTTLACLVLGLFAPQKGSLLLNGHPYTEFDLRDLRRGMAYVSQEAVLYDASVADNIRFGLDSADKSAIREAADRAQALDFIKAMPQGFDTPIGDRGIRLSGGERQRLALARAFLRNPEILVLDEPTSALDARSEEAVRIALNELMKGRTTLVVAHRLSLVRDLDRILVLDGGRFVEQGHHDELLQRGGLYATLHRLQQGDKKHDDK